MADKYDVVVVGAGAGGHAAAIRAAQLGNTVAVIDKRGVPGGAWLDAGGVPTKTLLHWTESYHHMRRYGKESGFDASALKVDFRQLQAAKDKVVASVSDSIRGLFDQWKIALIKGEARFVSPHMVEVAGGAGKQTCQGENFIIATGNEEIALPFLPIDGRKVVSASQALSLPQMPKSIIVVGAGIIGVEIASIYSRLGVTVTVVDKLDRVCGSMDLAISKVLRQLLAREGITFHMETEVVKGKISEDHVSLILSQGQQSLVLMADIVVLASGRKPHTKGMGLEDLGVEMTEKGFVCVGDTFRTAVPNLFAIGDAIEGVKMAHRASQEGVAVAEIIAGRKPHIDYLAMPNVVYTSPQAAAVGITEGEARDLKVDLLVGTSSFSTNAAARCSREEEGFVKIVGDKASGRLIGMHIIGPHASELIHEGVIALERRALVQDLANACHAHPTLSECIKEAALTAVDRSIHGMV